MPQIIIAYNRNAIAQYDLNIADINKIVNTALQDKAQESLFEGEKRFDIVVRLSGEQKRDARIFKIFWSQRRKGHRFLYTS